MEWWQAIILGIVEGLTEYLPVSSTGHLILTQRAMGLLSEEDNAYAICIQAGAIIAVLGLYWQRVRQAAVGWAGKVGLGKGDPQGFRLGLNLLVAFLPAALLGPILDSPIEAWLFHPWPVAAALFIGGIAILAVDYYRKWRNAKTKRTGDTDGAQDQSSAASAGISLEMMTLRMALIVGLMQCIAMWPGTSRSLVTIVGGVLAGLSLAAAVEFSFLLGVVTLLAATIYKAGAVDAIRNALTGSNESIMLIDMANHHGWSNLLLGVLAAWVSAIIAVKWMVGFLKKHGATIYTLTRNDINSFVQYEQDREQKAASVVNYLRVIYAFIVFLVDQGMLPRTILQPKVKVKLPEALPRAIPAEDVTSLLLAINNVRDKALLLLLLRTGMRIGELLEVKVSDINLTERKILIYVGEKNFQGRAVYYNDDGEAALYEWLHSRDESKQYLFYGRSDRPLNYVSAYNVMRKCIERAGLSGKGYSLHSLRHTFATDMLNAGMRLEVLQHLLGHQEIEMTMRYAKITDLTRENEYFKAMDRIEQGEKDEPRRVHTELQKIFEEKKLHRSKRK